MNGYKTLIALAVGLAAQILHRYNIDVEQEDQEALVTSIITMAALLAALWGGLKARRPGPFAPKGD